MLYLELKTYICKNFVQRTKERQFIYKHNPEVLLLFLASGLYTFLFYFCFFFLKMPSGNQKKSKKQRDNPTKPQTSQKEEPTGSLVQKADQLKTKLDQTCKQLDMLFKQNALETAKLGPRPELVKTTSIFTAIC